MPRKFSEADKAEWLQLYDNGKTEVWIAREKAKCDVRTIKKGLEEARRKQDVVVARRDLLRDALRKHQDSLFQELDRILSHLIIPVEDAAVESWYQKDLKTILTRAERLAESRKGKKASSGETFERNDAVLRLLKQHLRNDRLWKALAAWDKANAAHLASRIALQRKTIVLLEEKTGYEMVTGDNAHKPFLYASAAGVLFYTSALQAAFGDSKDINLKNDIIADTATGEVRSQSSILAKAPGNEVKTRDNLLKALEELKESSEVAEVLSTYNALKEKTTTARHIVENIKLIGMIPGQCEICRRLGM